MDSLRLEKCYRGWKQDMTHEYSPLTAALERFVSLPQSVLVGGDAVAEGGDAARESKLAAAAAPRAVGIERLNGKFTLYVLR